MRALGSDGGGLAADTSTRWRARHCTGSPVASSSRLTQPVCTSAPPLSTHFASLPEWTGFPTPSPPPVRR